MNNRLRHLYCLYKLSLRNKKYRIFNESLIDPKTKSPNKQRFTIFFYSQRNVFFVQIIKNKLKKFEDFYCLVESHLMCIFSIHFSSALNHDV